MNDEQTFKILAILQESSLSPDEAMLVHDKILKVLIIPALPRKGTQYFSITKAGEKRLKSLLKTPNPNKHD